MYTHLPWCTRQSWPALHRSGARPGSPCWSSSTPWLWTTTFLSHRGRLHSSCKSKLFFLLQEIGTSRVICILDDPVTFPAPIRSVIPAKVRVAARHRHGLLYLRPAVELCKVLEYLSKFIIRLYLPFKENANKTRNKYFMLLLCRPRNEKIHCRYLCLLSLWAYLLFVKT